MDETNPFSDKPVTPPAADASTTVTAVTEAVTTRAKFSFGVARDFIFKLFLYLPTSLVLFGFLADAIQQDFRYSIASLIGILSVFVNSLLGRLLKLVVNAPASVFEVGAGCTVPGFEAFESVFAAQGIVLPASIFTYFFIDFGLNRSASQNIGVAATFIGFLLLQLIVMGFSGCLTRYYWNNSFATIMMSLLFGGITGSIGWGVVKAVSPGRLPTANNNSSTPTPAHRYPLSPEKASSSVGTCSAPNDDDQLVCEAYKNGELVTTSIST
jgi:hypothetical protein